MIKDGQVGMDKDGHKQHRAPCYFKAVKVALHIGLALLEAWALCVITKHNPSSNGP